MASPFTETDLFSHISRDEWIPLSTELAQVGDPQPFPRLNEEAWGELVLYTGTYQVPMDVLKTHWRVLIFKFGYKRLSSLPKKWQAAAEETMKFLEDVRDGKFKHLAPVDPGDLPPELSPSQGAAWGSGKKFKTR